MWKTHHLQIIFGMGNHSTSTLVCPRVTSHNIVFLCDLSRSVFFPSPNKRRRLHNGCARVWAQGHFPIGRDEIPYENLDFGGEFWLHCNVWISKSTYGVYFMRKIRDGHRFTSIYFKWFSFLVQNSPTHPGIPWCWDYQGGPFYVTWHG